MQEQRPRGPRSGHPLTKAVIIDAAMLIVEQGGANALTLRRLGAELGTDHTAVLRHFRGKDQIILGLAERLMSEALSEFEPGSGWRATLSQLARQVRQTCIRHPSVAVLAAMRVSRSPDEFRGADIVIAALSQVGLRGRKAALIYRTITDLALAAGSYEAAMLTLDESARDGDREALRREYLLASPRDYPHLAAVAQFLADVDDEEQFETALELILDGIEVHAARVAGSSETSPG
ncbi:TetR/AcrR family tetracycline transcriptional repressor [Microbacterium natoriense]|uniref:TetR/AcrR family tetracycline transcriptional repressor n=1 Tax=Microbacterium natoriense TaxID=284570 RepID=A0AAW8F084_9MICO|nr:TetR/AcrR family transcriptional regulator [Microbacterium natoriense]MDQ0648032.1 TetR/AcrR family tetracycline transcriptional repressor [Microbacterium natoriense]